MKSVSPRRSTVGASMQLCSHGSSGLSTGWPTSSRQCSRLKSDASRRAGDGGSAYFFAGVSGSMMIRLTEGDGAVMG